MRSFYSGIYINRELLMKNNIDHPVRLEYYRIKNDAENEKESYGIEVVKTEYVDGKPKVEKEAIQYITNNEKFINNFLDSLKLGCVTPVEVKEIAHDYFEKM